MKFLGELWQIRRSPSTMLGARADEEAVLSVTHGGVRIHRDGRHARAIG
jgi:hypothetical protein